MNGGSYDYVMGNMVNSSGAFYSSSSSFSSPYPNSKYYDKYSYYSSTTQSLASRSRSKLSDGIKETIKNMDNTSSGAGWGYYGYRNISSASYSWFVRGGDAHYVTNSGVFSSYGGSGSASYYYSSRPVLTVSREFPWVNK